jgi:glycogen operon protein
VTAVESHRHNCLVVGEDLGTVPDGLRQCLSAANVFSYRVLWFERDGAGLKPPQSYPRCALACLASHDLPTFFGWRAGHDIDLATRLGHLPASGIRRRRAERHQEIRALDTLCGLSRPTPAEASVAAHGLVASTPSQIMLAQADDLAGETEPLNMPGTDREHPNWRRRIHRPVERLIAEEPGRSILARIRVERAK